MTKFIELSTNNLVLRDHVASDLPSHHKLFSDKNVMYYLPDIRTKTLLQSEENLQQCMGEIHNPHRQFYFLRIEEKATGNHVGEIGYTVEAQTPVGKRVGMGYFSHQAYWGKGYMTQAVQELFAFGFLQNDVFRFQTGCLVENIGSMRVMEKCGMVKEDHYKKYTWHDGALKDRVEYRLLKEEWTMQETNNTKHF